MGSFQRKLQRAGAAHTLPPLSAQLERFAQPLLAQPNLIEGMSPEDLSNLLVLGWNMGLLIADDAETDTEKAVSDMVSTAFVGEVPGDAEGADLFVTLMTSMVELRRGVFASDRRSVDRCLLRPTDEGYEIEVVEGAVLPERAGKALPS